MQQRGRCLSNFHQQVAVIEAGPQPPEVTQVRDGKQRLGPVIPGSSRKPCHGDAVPITHQLHRGQNPYPDRLATFSQRRTQVVRTAAGRASSQAEPHEHQAERRPRGLRARTRRRRLKAGATRATLARRRHIENAAIRLSAAQGDPMTYLAREQQPDGILLRASGPWNVENLAAIDATVRRLPPTGTGAVRIDLSGLSALDTAGAWLVDRLRQTLEADGGPVQTVGARPEHKLLLRKVAESFRPCEEAPPAGNPLLRLVEHVGEATLTVLDTAATYVSFLGRAFLTLVRGLIHPRRLRLTSVTFHVEQVGINAMPIVGLISFLIGIVLVYQGALQLANFGANIFVVDLLALSVLRELGILLTAIVVAGRSGSAFAAQIGSMKLHEEIDALQTLGVDPMEVLVLPRTLALVISLPLLALFADLSALLGGGLMCWLALDLSPDLFMSRLQSVATVSTFMVGIVKAPVFAVLIALAGCYEGMQVTGSAESVGHHTTRSVVESIFLVIVADALFSIFFGLIGI